MTAKANLFVRDTTISRFARVRVIFYRDFIQRDDFCLCPAEDIIYEHAIFFEGARRFVACAVRVFFKFLTPVSWKRAS